MRPALALIGALASLAGPIEARAQDALDATIVQHGLYTIETTGTVIMPNGISSDTIASICHVATTTTIPAAQGVHFGFRFRIDGPTPGQPVEIRKIVRFPMPVKPPLGAGAVAAFDSVGAVVAGAVSYTGYGLDYAWEIVPGPWMFELHGGGRKLAEMRFVVTPGVEAPAERSDGGDCLPLSGLPRARPNEWALARHLRR